MCNFNIIFYQLTVSYVPLLYFSMTNHSIKYTIFKINKHFKKFKVLKYFKMFLIIYKNFN